MSFRIKNIGVGIKEYFGFVEANVTWRQRCRHFLASERRSFARLIGTERPSRPCKGRPDS
ncbi:MAG: hypothetical protein O7A98_04415 [Acidobacteria bacterium]|nr:hypothetical protein [Acidobacteriota bacterium]